MRGGRLQIALLILLRCASFGWALKNGLAITPPMGFNTWNAFKTNSESCPLCHLNLNKAYIENSIKKMKMQQYESEYYMLHAHNILYDKMV